MEVDSASETRDSFDLDIMGGERAVVEYSRTKNIGGMGRWLHVTHSINANLSKLMFKNFSYRFYFFGFSRDEVVALLDSIDNRVETLRKEALKLQEERDLILTRIDMLKHTDLLTSLSAADHEEIHMTLQRINERLQVTLETLTSRLSTQRLSLPRRLTSM